jgi:hypothetical protein
MLVDGLLTHDESPRDDHVFGDARGAQHPHLAIEVIWTSGGLDKREVLRGIDLAELTSFLDRPSASRAILDYRAALQARSRG